MMLGLPARSEFVSLPGRFSGFGHERWARGRWVGVGFHASVVLVQGVEGAGQVLFQASSGSFRRRCLSSEMAARIVVVVPASGACLGMSSHVLRAQVMSFPAVAKSLYRHRFTSHLLAVWPVGSAASCSQESRFMARAAIFAQAWLALKS